MKTLLKALPKAALGLLVATGIAGTVAASAQPAQAGVIVAVGFGGGYVAPPPYHWHRWHDRDGWHRAWVRVGWAPPVAYVGPVYAYAPSYAYGPGSYGPGYSGARYYGPRYAPAYVGRHDWDRAGYRDRDWDRARFWH